MLAYLFWHRPHSTTTVKQYEEALLRFQQHLGQQDPPGFRGSASFRVADLPWLGNQPGYEDWCLLDGSWALDPLNSFAVAGPVVSAHDAAATQMEDGYGGLYALVWGEPALPERSTTVWLTRPRGIQWRPVLGHCASAIPANDIMAASDGTRSGQGVCADRAGGRRCRCAIRLVWAPYRAGACRRAPGLSELLSRSGPDVARSRFGPRLWPSRSDANPVAA